MNKRLAGGCLWILLVWVLLLLLPSSPAAAQTASPPATPTPTLFGPATPQPQGNTILYHFNGFGDTLVRVVPVLFLAALLGGLVAYRRQLTVFEHHLFHAHILLSVAGALMMLIVGNQLVRAFGLLGAASVVRYRYGLRNPRDASMLIIALGIGMATGVGLYALAVSAAAVVFFFARGLEYLTTHTNLLIVVTRPVILRVRTVQPEATIARLERIFARHHIQAQLRRYRRTRRRRAGKRVHTLTYVVRIGPDVSRTRLTTEITDEAVLSVRWQTEKPRKQ